MPQYESRRLAGKTAVITGATTGLGFESARRFIAEGARVIITGQNAERLAEAAESLGPAAIPVRANSTSLADLDALAESVRENFGSLDIVFVNAGIGVFAPLTEVTEEGYDRQFDINVKGALFTVQKLLPLLKKGSSVILNASAVNAKGMPGGSIYFASKAAVRSFARSLAAELGPEGIRVNSLSPGVVRTPFMDKVDLPKEAMDGFVTTVSAQAPLGRTGLPEEIAQAAVFLGSDDSSYTTGADLTVDGGWMNV